MNKKMLSLILTIINIVIIAYFLFSILSPLMYRKEFKSENLKKDLNEETYSILDQCYNKYITAVLSKEKDTLKSMLPLVSKINLNSYDTLFETNEEREIINQDQYIIFDISRISGNIYQIKSYIKTGSLVDGLTENVVIIKLNKSSKSFKVLYDSALGEGE